MSKKSDNEFDVRSAEPVLYYTGPGIVSDVAADTLSGNMLARVVWTRSEERPDSPNDVSQDAIATLRDELLASGNYSTTKPAEPVEEPASEPVEEPA